MSLDNFKKQTITWDMINQAFEQPIQIMEGDVNARTLLLKITDNGSVLDLTGYSVKLTYQYMYKSQSGFIMLTPNDISKGEFTLIIPTEMTVSGLIKSNLILLNEDKEQVIVSKNLTFISDDSTVTSLTCQGPSKNVGFWSLKM
ncbi:phage baseplate upper protein [Lactococcus cremoris]|uniref:phage baseplate upper protein n=1 Tax=Lactococcus lactis subsp. cremoris TaxID=1359 RepID=UPI001AF56AD9|nr:phage baseplate upper protein [Lactococcus cremoris]QRZ32225.1 phage baseplate upper protein [Lactococcus cremoris]